MSKTDQTLIAPSILAANFGELRSQIAAVEKAGADLIHLDIMDGHFVPNISFGSFVVKTVHGLTRLPLDTHLMIENPDSFLQEFQKAGTRYLTVHVEACKDLRKTMTEIRRLGMNPGVSLKPGTPLSSLDEVLPIADLVLVMSVEPGFGGQKFMPESLVRIRKLHETISKRGLKTLIEVDGGVDEENAMSLKKAGAQILVAGTAIFGAKDISKAVDLFKRNLGEYH